MTATQTTQAMGGPGPILPPPMFYSTVLMLGDSITQSQHTDDFYYAMTWQTVLGLRQRSSQNAAVYLFDGVGGAGVQGYTDHLNTLGIMPGNAQLVIVELGTNDYGSATPLTTFQNAYQSLLWSLAAKNPQAKLCALSIWGDPSAANAAGILGSAYNSAITAMAAAWGGSGGHVVVDISTLFLNPAYHWPAGSSDTFHPNRDGHIAIANAILAAG